GNCLPRRDSLLEDENFFEMNDKKVESFERKTKEDFETKVELEKKKELQVFHPDIEILDHLETISYVGNDYVFYEDFNLVDMIFPMNVQGKIFDLGIIFHEKSFENDTFKDKSSKELAPSKALLTLDVFNRCGLLKLLEIIMINRVLITSSSHWAHIKAMITTTSGKPFLNRFNQSGSRHKSFHHVFHLIHFIPA
ncbi:hypothetical protein Tco_0192725, partial [Tanacetum coccineum]